jgi:enoyl-CoA hydratase/carnithine racemase
MDLIQTQYKITNGIALITLNRPEKKNAFTPQMRKELIWLMEKADQDNDVRVVVVTGSGDAFCAGADLSAGGATFDWAKKKETTTINDHRDGGGQVSLAIYKCRKPVIAAINGHAVGVGITMTLAMDMRIVAEDAKIGFVFSRRGVVMEACSSWFLPRIVGLGKANELALTGRIFKAKEELGSGLFNHVVPKEKVLSKAMEIAGEINENTSGISVALNKSLLQQGLGDEDPHTTHLVDSRCFYWAGMQKDAKEGIQSFLEKRPPVFSMKVSDDMPDFYPWWKEPEIDH